MSAMSWEASYDGSAANGSAPFLPTAERACPTFSLLAFPCACEPNSLAVKAAPDMCGVIWSSGSEPSAEWQAGAQVAAFAVSRAPDPDWRRPCCGSDAPIARPHFALVGRWPLLATVPPPPPALSASPRRCCREVCRRASRATRSSEGRAGRCSRNGGRLRSADDARELGALPRADPALLDETRLSPAEDACNNARVLGASAVREARVRSTEPAREAAVELATDDAREDERDPPAVPARAVGGCVRSADDVREDGRLLAFDDGRLTAFEPGREGSRGRSRAEPALPSGRPPRTAATRRCTTFSSASSWRL